METIIPSLQVAKIVQNYSPSHNGKKIYTLPQNVEGYQAAKLGFQEGRSLLFSPTQENKNDSNSHKGIYFEVLKRLLTLFKVGHYCQRGPVRSGATGKNCSIFWPHPYTVTYTEASVVPLSTAVWYSLPRDTVPYFTFNFSQTFQLTSDMITLLYKFIMIQLGSPQSVS